MVRKACVHEPTRADYEPWYRALRANDVDGFRQAIQSAEGLALTHNLSTKVAADIESAMVMLACAVGGFAPLDASGRPVTVSGDA